MFFLQFYKRTPNQPSESIRQMFSLFFIFACNFLINEVKRTMKKQVFKFLAKANKAILPSYTKQRLDLSKASKLQMAIFGWKVYVTKNALD